MKKIITILLLTAPVMGLAQKVAAQIGYNKKFTDSLQYDKVVLPKTIQLSPDLIKKILAINNVQADGNMLKNYFNTQESNKSDIVIKYQNGLGNINIMQPDNMPCLVPNLQSVAAMPIVKPLATDNMPNPLHKEKKEKK
ncbi:MAG: hypothetical protein EAZ16_07070 [Sphingobacteriales bacterium]|nr:MAG: hypothetical protein EAZ16_07070 [Sphingobacteriales bacterium]